MRVIKILAVAALLLAGLASVAAAYIGVGVQGRPHGGHTAERMLMYRHGLPYHHHHRHHYNY